MAGFWKQPNSGVRLGLLAAALAACSPGEAAMPDYAPAPAAKASVGRTPALGKCINLANTLEPPNEGDWGPAFRDEDARIIRSAGFSTVRVPVNFVGHTLAQPPYTIDRKFVARARQVIDTLR